MSSEQTSTIISSIEQLSLNENNANKQENIKPRLPRISIEFCTQCRWVLRAGWTAQELLVTFGTIIGEVALIPGVDAVFIVQVDGETVWDRKKEGRFPELKELKQLIRNRIAPDMNLGHSDNKKKATTDTNTSTQDADACGKDAYFVTIPRMEERSEGLADFRTSPHDISKILLIN
ncbi:23224_t:CDS:2 [Cetraspora pellucida]|uniref:23224_t:CDS:1 n=1 Tax=Cetraspora pellucida TaxID=1433469 RepID=A0A9N9AQH8_9GLOM|nr:23224_t:CDS:2 [Cetraspora pellucida]